MSVVVFFFCKQKTAYEMRISEWSSDVCSSDLVMFCSESLATVSARTTIGRSDGKVNFAAEATSGKASKTSKTSSKMGFARNPFTTMLQNRDRKSVVEGKSVSVRVDLGGRRSIKKKKHNNKKAL